MIDAASLALSPAESPNTQQRDVDGPSQDPIPGYSQNLSCPEPFPSGTGEGR